MSCGSSTRCLQYLRDETLSKKEGMENRLDSGPHVPPNLKVLWKSDIRPLILNSALHCPSSNMGLQIPELDWMDHLLQEGVYCQ